MVSSRTFFLSLRTFLASTTAVSASPTSPETEALIKSLESQKSGLEGEVGDAETAVVNAKKTRKDKKKVLDDTMVFLRSIAPSCDYMAVNFELRKANREAEIDGLIEAGASLQGGAFGKAAFLQKSQDEC